MPSTTIRPNGTDTTVYPAYLSNTGGAASVQAALSDASDTTYCRKNGGASGDPIAALTLADPTIPASNDVATIVPRIRTKDGGTHFSASVARIVRLPYEKPLLGGGYLLSWRLVPMGISAKVTASSGASSAVTDSLAVTSGPAIVGTAICDAALLFLYDTKGATDSGRAYIYDVWADVYYAARPSAAVTSPTSSQTFTDTSNPPITTRITGLVESWQDGTTTVTTRSGTFEVRIFTAAQYGAGGFDPATATPIWSTKANYTLPYTDGATNSTVDVTAQIPTSAPLANGTYRAYVRAVRGFDAAQYGSFAYTQFTINVTPMAVPTLTSAISGQRVQLQAVMGSLPGGHSNPLLTIERSSDSGTSWTAIRNANDLEVSASDTFTVYDDEAPRGTASIYRARAETTVSSNTVSSAWSSSTAGVTVPLSGWNLKVPQTPALSIVGARVLKDPDYTQTEDIGVFRPKGRTYPVVVSNALGGADGGMEVKATTEAEWAALVAVRELQEPVYVESPFGWARWVRFTGRAWTERGYAGSARRTLKLEFVETEGA